MTTLTPPDRARCQADKRVGNPFALGNLPRWKREFERFRELYLCLITTSGLRSKTWL